MKVFEIGVGEIWQCRTAKYINSNVECWLFEPNPRSFENLKEYLDEEKNFKLFNLAIGLEEKICSLVCNHGSSYINGTVSPLFWENNKAREEFESVNVQMKKITDFDKGDIDMLLLDMEGTEYDVLLTMVSRPSIIIIEMELLATNYKNPNYDKILNWMKESGYHLESRNEDFIFRKL